MRQVPNDCEDATVYLMQQSISVNLSIPLYHGGPGMSKLHLLEDDEHDNYKLNTNLKQLNALAYNTHVQLNTMKWMCRMMWQTSRNAVHGCSPWRYLALAYNTHVQLNTMKWMCRMMWQTSRNAVHGCSPWRYRKPIPIQLILN